MIDRFEVPPGPRRADAVWLAVLLLLLAAFAVFSWAQWPLVTADSARELYVPFQWLGGAVIYRDFAYLYGPLAPGVQAGLLGLFGARLEVLYIASLLHLAATLALLYALARQVLAPAASAGVAFVFLTHFALGRDIWGYVWPYAFAATFGVTEGLVLLVALARHAADGRRAWLTLAGLAAGAALVTKLEFGFAAGLVLASYGLLEALRRPGWRVWAADALAAFAPLALVAGATVSWVLSRVPLPVVLESVWPTKLMALWNSAGAWHGDAASWVSNVELLAVDAAVLLALLTLPRWGRRPVGMGAIALGACALAGLALTRPATLGYWLGTWPSQWMGPGFLLLFGLLAACATRLVKQWRAGQPPDAVLVTWTLVGLYGCLVATRTLMHGYNDYTRYQAPVALVAWAGLAVSWLPGWLSRRGIAPRPGANCLLAALVVALGGRHLAFAWSDYARPAVAVSGPAGTLVTPVAFGEPYNQAVAFLRAHTRPGDAILAAPMEASLYLFTGCRNPLHEDQLFWGYLTTPAEQQAAIQRLEAARTRYVVVSSYQMNGQRFGETYMQDLGAWLRAKGRPVAAYGGPAYGLRIFATPWTEGP